MGISSVIKTVVNEAEKKKEAENAAQTAVEKAAKHEEAKKKAEAAKFDVQTGERTRWGERIGNSGSGTTDWVDSDRDGIDDRYQKGPGGPAWDVAPPPPGLPPREDVYILPWERDDWGSGDYERIGLKITKDPVEKISETVRRPGLRTGVFHPTTGLQRDYIYMPTEKEQRRERAYDLIGPPELRRHSIRDPAEEKPKEYGRWQDAVLEGYTPSRTIQPVTKPREKIFRPDVSKPDPTPREKVSRPHLKVDPPMGNQFPKDKTIKNRGGEDFGGKRSPEPPKWDERPAYIAPWDRDDWGSKDYAYMPTEKEDNNYRRRREMPRGFTAPERGSINLTVMDPWVNRRTGETWHAPSSGYRPEEGSGWERGR